jgi:KDO2-lipid IV(A) lauroyltransferase
MRINLRQNGSKFFHSFIKKNMAQYVGFVAFLIFVNFFKFVPYSVLYVFSDFLYYVLRYVVKYRKSVVYDNLKRCFPEKTEAEIDEIARKFYRHFCDITVESLKGFTLGKEALMKRVVYTQPYIVENFLKKGISCISTPAHYNNWEYPGLAASLYTEFQVDILYKPLSNKLIDDFFRKKRKSFGTEFWSIYETQKLFTATKEQTNVTVMVSDQSPGNVRKAVWVEFFGIDTAFLHGAEYYARKNNCALVYADIHKIKRGHYEVYFVTYAEPPYDNVPYGELTRLYAVQLEKSIREKPEYWLWSHKRWKHTR